MKDSIPVYIYLYIEKKKEGLLRVYLQTTIINICIKNEWAWNALQTLKKYLHTYAYKSTIQIDFLLGSKLTKFFLSGSGQADLFVLSKTWPTQDSFLAYVYVLRGTK